ncbi:MAG TPA: hypothetical protein VGO34_15030 [Alphaproteobacteria bacterium]|jgi:hypothetical protein
MTMRTRDTLVCECGHEGSVVCAENDQPFSKCWESYSLEGFNGGHVGFDRFPTQEEMAGLLKSLNPECPKCASHNVVYKKTL